MDVINGVRRPLRPFRGGLQPLRPEAHESISIGSEVKKVPIRRKSGLVVGVLAICYSNPLVFTDLILIYSSQFPRASRGRLSRKKPPSKTSVFDVFVQYASVTDRSLVVSFAPSRSCSSISNGKSVGQNRKPIRPGACSIRLWFLKTSSASELLDLQRAASTLLRPCLTLY